MSTYVLMTKLSPEALKEPREVDALGKDVSARIKAEVPQAKWICSYALLGPYDYLDIFDAPDNSVATKVALIIRSFGHATTETWVATEWDRFLGLVKEMR
ncbi:MAG: GYD domain-containing protein [Chloroflexi bacterium]|nr:GYD domain-containing protein [Chloroflexota bacterium]